MAAQVVLVVLDVWISYGRRISDRRIRDLFSLGAEDGLGTWFSSAQLFILALVLGALSFQERRQALRRPGWWAAGWLGIICLYLSVDEVARIHERLGRAIRQSGLADSYPSYHWHLAMSPLLLIAATLTVFLVARNLRLRRTRLLVGIGLVFWIVAVSVDFGEGFPHAHSWLAETLSISPRFVGHFSRVTEELFEMLGCSLLLTGFLTDLIDRVSHVELDLT